MRTSNYRALLVGLAGIAVSGAAGDLGCSATKPTEIVPGALTQVQVPKDLAAIKLIVLANGSQKFCQGYQVNNGQVELPSTLGVVGGNSNTTVSVALYGYDQASATSPDVNQCFGSLPVDAPQSAGGGQGPGARILREAVLTFVDQQTLFLPLPLSFSCYDVDCSSQGANSTCIAGACGSNAVDSTKLAPFTPSLVDGTGDCFDSNQCFATSVPATVVNAQNCTYALPAGIPATTAGVNVRIAYTDVNWVVDPGTGIYGPQPGVPLEQEILSEDPNEGFIIPDPTQPTQIQLAPNLCALAQRWTTPPQNPPATYHTISNVEIAVGCPTKVPLLPFCAGEQHNNVSTSATPSVVACGLPIELDPTPSALYLVMDDSGSMYGAFGKQGYATAMSLSFASPVFRRTYVAFRFLTHSGCNGTNGTSYTSLQTSAGQYPFGLAPVVQPGVATSLLNWTAPDTYNNPKPLDLLAAMDLDTGTYAYLHQFEQHYIADGGTAGPFNVAAAVFFLNRAPASTSGGGDGGVGDGGDAGGGGGGDSGTDFPPTAADCPVTSGTITTALSSAAQQAFAQGLQTFFIVLNDQELDPQPQVDFYNGVKNAGGGTTPSGITVLPATVPNDLQGVANTLSSVASCLYDAPAGIDTTATLTFTVPPGNVLNPSSVAVPQQVGLDPNCSATTPLTDPGGWTIDTSTNRIRICGKPCAELQAAIAATVGASLSPPGDGGTGTGNDAGLPVLDGGTPVIPDVPVTVEMQCPADAGLP